MNTQSDHFERYIRDTLGGTPEVTPWKESRQLALFLRDRYHFFEASILDQPCLLMADNGDREEPPTTIRKHINQVQDKWKGPVIYVRERITAYNRKRLVEQKMPFVVPGNQMYLPMIGIDFREYFRAPHCDTTGLRFSSQAVLIYALLQNTENMGPTAMAKKLGYSAMTMSRSLDELNAAGIIETTSTGRGSDRCLRFNGPKREVWEKAEPLLKTPVKNCHTILMNRHGKLPGLKAGFNALAHDSMLAEPANVTVALDRKGWKLLLQKNTVNKAMVDEPGVITVEVWGYDPTLFAADGRVDRLSLYLSLRETDDERVQSALEKMMKAFAW